jgi:hypothetical protein
VVDTSDTFLLHVLILAPIPLHVFQLQRQQWNFGLRLLSEQSQVKKECVSTLATGNAGQCLNSLSSMSSSGVKGVVYIFGVKLLTKLKVDDVVLGIPIHFFCGTWSVIATGLFSSPSAMRAAFGTDEYVGWFYELGRGRYDATLLTSLLPLSASLDGHQLSCILFSAHSTS